MGFNTGKCGYWRGKLSAGVSRGLQGGKVWVLRRKTVSRYEEGATGWESVGTEGENCQQV